MIDPIQVPILLKQEYVDILFELQCCFATKAISINNSSEIGNACEDETFTELVEIYLLLETLLCQDIYNENCLKQDDILFLLNYLKTKCDNCCIDFKKLKKLLEL